MSPVLVGGIDPGPTPGLVLLHIADGRILRIERGPHLTPAEVVERADYVAVETYVRGARSARAGDSRAQLVTETMVADVRQRCVLLGKTCQALPAGAVKPWADDERLRSYGEGDGMHDMGLSVYDLTRGGGGHDRDAARHALSFSVKLNLLPRR